MRAQHETRFDQNRAERVAVVTDSTCDLPPTLLEELAVGVVPVRVYFGSENYLDKVTLTPSEFYARFAVTTQAPRTSQPPPADFTQVYENVATHAGSIVSIHLSAAVSGTYQAAIVGSRPVEKTRFEHVDSRNVSVGLGLVVRAAAEAAAAGRSADEVARIARDAADPARLFIAVPTLEHLVRGGRVSPSKGLLAKVARASARADALEGGGGGARREGARIRGGPQKMMALLFESPRTPDTERAAASAWLTATPPELADVLAQEIRQRYPESDVHDRRVRPGARSARRAGRGGGGGAAVKRGFALDSSGLSATRIIRSSDSSILRAHGWRV